MRANNKNLVITSYAEYNHLDSSTIKIQQSNHLFDVEPASRKSHRRTYVDQDAAASTREATTTIVILTLMSK